MCFVTTREGLAPEHLRLSLPSAAAGFSSQLPYITSLNAVGQHVPSTPTVLAVNRKRTIESKAADQAREMRTKRVKGPHLYACTSCPTPS